MELPKAPDDPELRTIIDKLANFVARNGPEFEQMTKNKQRDNPKFSFLYGGEYFNYYQYKVTTEQAIINQQKQKMAQVQQNLSQQSVLPWQQNQALQQQIQMLQQQIQQEELKVHDQILQSEKNLTAQYTSLTQSQQIQVDDLVTKLRSEKIDALSSQCGLSVTEFNGVVQPIIDACTKDAISNGKNWIFNKAVTVMQYEFISTHLLNRILARDTPFETRLHLIYLINDLLHHSQRRGVEQMKMHLANIVVPAFCTTISGVDDDKKHKLDKLLTLWEKNKYFKPSAVEKMRDSASALAEYQASCVNEHAEKISTIAASIQQQYAVLQAQHKEYSDHLSQRLTQQRAQLQQLLTQQQTLNSLSVANNMSVPPPGMMGMPPTMDQQMPFAPYMPPAPVPFDPSRPPPNLPMPDAGVGMGGGMSLIPDMSRPPPGFPEQPQPIPEMDLVPTVPYYDLPAGLMCPLVKLEDFDYKPLDPKDIRLPPPAPPTEKLLAAVEAFYSAPSHDSPRDGKGWEKLGLYEYFQSKYMAKNRMFGANDKKLELNSHAKSRSKSRSPERSRSKSESRSRSRSKSGSRSRSYSPRKERSYSRSPDNNRGRRHSRSPFRRSRSRSGDRSYNDYQYDMLPMDPNMRISEDNRGHMLMKKMGWAGQGLGVQEQGMVDPIEGASARDKIDMYKGIGMQIDDPFEQFRKKNSHGFIQKLRTRDEERKSMRSRDERDEPRS